MGGHLLVVGPLPPPLEGRAIATGLLVDALGDRGCPLVVVNTGHVPSLWSRPRKVIKAVQASIRILARPPDLVIIVASGGLGMLTEIAPAAAARVRRRPIRLLHHSAAYIRRPSLLFRVLSIAGGVRLRHVVLHEAMGKELEDQYGLCRDQWTVLDNASLVPLAPEVHAMGRSARAMHLATLSADKGTLAVLEVARQLAREQKDFLPIRLVGPVRPDVRSQIEGAVETGVVEYGGVLSGRGKITVLRDSRVLLLPSRYRHEAQPLVVYEAASAGVVPVVWAQGWITEQMANLGLERFVFEEGDLDGMVEATAEVLALGDREFLSLSADVRTSYEALHERSRRQIERALS